MYLKNLDLPPGRLNSGTTTELILGNLASGSFSRSFSKSSLYIWVDCLKSSIILLSGSSSNNLLCLPVKETSKDLSK